MTELLDLHVLSGTRCESQGGGGFCSVSWEWRRSGRTGAQGALTIAVLSSRPDMVSGGNALVEIKSGDDRRPHRHAQRPGRHRRVPPDTRRGRPSSAWSRGFASAPTPSRRAAARASARLQLTNHPITGPIVSGPASDAVRLQHGRNPGLGEPLDENCSATTKVDYFYRSTLPPPPVASLQPLGRTSALQAVRPIWPGRDLPTSRRPRRPTARRCPTSSASSRARSIARSIASRSSTIPPSTGRRGRRETAGIAG